MLTSCIISEMFLPSSFRETTYFSNLFLYLNLNALIMPASSGCNLETTFWQKDQFNLFKIILECFWVARWVIAKENISAFYLDFAIKKSQYIKIFLTLIFGRIRYREVISTGKC